MTWTFTDLFCNCIKVLVRYKGYEGPKCLVFGRHLPLLFLFCIIINWCVNTHKTYKIAISMPNIIKTLETKNYPTLILWFSDPILVSRFLEWKLDNKNRKTEKILYKLRFILLPRNISFYFLNAQIRFLKKYKNLAQFIQGRSIHKSVRAYYVLFIQQLTKEYVI